MLESFIRAADEYTTKKKSIPAPYIRRSFTLDFEPEKAILRIATPGFYELYINGKNITKGYLAPYISNPDDLVCYDEYNVEKYLTKGKNAIGIILGNGFANQTVTSWDFDKATFRAPLSVAVDLVAKGEGSFFTITSDESFKTHPSHIVYDMYRYGTHIDSRLYIKGWNMPDFDDSCWQNASLSPKPKGSVEMCKASPIVKVAELKPIKITEQNDVCYLKTAFRAGENIPSTKVSGYLYDFGRSSAGVCRIRIKGNKGQTVTLRHGERLTDSGEFNLNSIYTFKPDYADYIHLYQTDVFVLSGEGEEVFIPPFTYHGFRDVLVEGITREQATDDLLTFEVISSATPRRASFSSSSDTLNTLFLMGINADVSNFHYFPTDCPHREKNGWTGDISVSAEQLIYNFDCSRDLVFWLTSFIRAQRADGSLPGIVPTTGWGFSWGNGPMWDSAIVTVPYYAYKYDGYIDLPDGYSDALYRYLLYLDSRRDERGLIAIGLGDWCQPRAEGEPISAPLVLTDSVTAYDIMKKSAFIFDLLGDKGRKGYVESFAADLRLAIRKHLIDLYTMRAVGDCQTSETLIISHGIIEEAEKERAYARLIDLIHSKDDHLYVGMIGLRFIFDVLIDGGDVDLALKLIIREDEPSYGSMIRRGATALCESIMENGLNESENHHFLGDIIRIFESRLAGLKVNPYMRDKDEVIFSPSVPDLLDHAEASYSFKSGICHFGWRRNAEGILLHIDVPDGVKGRIEYGTLSSELSTGYQEFYV